MMIMQDPPDHHRLRSLVSKVFHPRSIQGLEPMVAEVIRGYADQLDRSRAFDAVDDFAAPFPVEIISRMLGRLRPTGRRSVIGSTSRWSANPGERPQRGRSGGHARGRGLLPHRWPHNGSIPATTC